MPNLSRRGASYTDKHPGQHACTHAGKHAGSHRSLAGRRKTLASIAAIATSVASLGHWAVAADTLIFDAGGTATSSSTTVDGTGTWDNSTPDFYDATSGGPSDVTWASGDNAVFGGGSSGTAGAITVSGAQSFNTLTFVNPFSGSYALSGSALTVGTSIVDNLTTANASIADAVAFGTGATTLSGTGTGTVSFTGALSGTGTLAISGGDFSLITTPGSAVVQLAGGTLLTPNNYLPATSKVQLVGGASSIWNLGGTNINGSATFSNGTGYGKAYNPLTYSGSGVATIGIQNGMLYQNGTDLSPQTNALPPSTLVNPTVVNLGSTGALGANGGVTNYLTGITGSGDLFSTNASSTWTMTLTPLASTTYLWTGTTFDASAGTQIALSLTVDGSASGTQIVTGYLGVSKAITITQGNLVLAHPTGNNLGAALTINGGALYVSGGTTVANATPNAVDQNVTVNSGGTLSDDTTIYNSALGQSAPAGASFVSANTTTITNGGNLTVVNGAELLTGHLALNAGSNVYADLSASGGTVSSTPMIDTRNSGSNTLAPTINVIPASLGSGVAVGNYHLLEYYTTAGAFTSTQFNDFGLTAGPTGYVYQLANNTTAKSIDLNVYNHSLASFTSANNTPDANTGATAPATAITADTINLGSFNVGDGGGSELFSLGHILANIGVSAVGLELSSVTPGVGNVENIGYTPATFTGSSSLAAGAIESAGGVATLDTSSAGTFSNTFTLNLEDNQSAGVSGSTSNPAGLNAIGSETLTLTLDGSVGTSSTPEPGTFGILAVAAIAGLGQRRRRTTRLQAM